MEEQKKFQVIRACSGFTLFIHLPTIKNTGGTDNSSLELKAV